MELHFMVFLEEIDDENEPTCSELFIKQEFSLELTKRCLQAHSCCVSLSGLRSLLFCGCRLFRLQRLQYLLSRKYGKHC